MRLILFFVAVPLIASTPQDRAIRRLEKMQHKIQRDNRESEKLGKKAQDACAVIGKVLVLLPSGIMDCGVPPKPEPPKADTKQ